MYEEMKRILFDIDEKNSRLITLKNEAGEYIPYEYDTYEYRMAKMLSECE